MTADDDRRREFTRYLVAGALNTAATYALLVAAMQWLNALVAYTIVYALGVLLAYALQSRFVFRVPVGWRTALRFPAVYVMQYALGMILLWLLARLTTLSPRWSALVVVAATVPVGFVLSRALLRGRAASGRVAGAPERR